MTHPITSSSSIVVRVVGALLTIVFATAVLPPTHWMPFPEPPTPNDGWTLGREITPAQLEAACAAYLAHGQPGADPQAAWDMLGEQYKPAIRARIRGVLRAGSGA